LGINIRAARIIYPHGKGIKVRVGFSVGDIEYAERKGFNGKEKYKNQK
jgi:hypothetical protein